jgi:hypothetical protein
VVVARQGALRLLAFKIFVNEVFFDTYEADGIIVSTPTGSTGYNLSAGGPIVSPKASLILVTPVAPHSLSKKSVVFSPSTSENVSLKKGESKQYKVTFDGKDVTTDSKITWTLDGKYKSGTKIEKGVLTVASDETATEIKFKVKETDEEFLIATTRPELLPAIVCVFINPKDEKNKHMIGKTAHIPVLEIDVPIMADEKVAMDKGTGVVMCCTFGDQTDIEWWKKYKLPLKNIFTDDGKIKDDVKIGSNTVLVAPVKVNEGANVGAGSVITKEVPAWALAITRSPLKVLADWVGKKKKS